MTPQKGAPNGAGAPGTQRAAAGRPARAAVASVTRRASTADPLKPMGQARGSGYRGRPSR
eukprot:1635039-Lingulodinium_polyedra.AAC.1